MKKLIILAAIAMLAVGSAPAQRSQQEILNHHTWSQELEDLAEEGVDMAQNNLATMYKTGNGIDKDLNKAVYWYTRSSEAGNPTAMANLGALYLTGDGVDQDIPRAIELFTLSAEKENPAGLINLAVVTWQGKGVESDLNRAFELATRAATAENHLTDKVVKIKIHSTLGLMHQRGMGTPQDNAKAMDEFGIAAEYGSREAAAMVAGSYEQGLGVAPDPTKAEKYFRLAAEQGGIPVVQYLVARRYALGDVFAQNSDDALHYLELAAANPALEPMLRGDACLKIAGLLRKKGGASAIAKAEEYEKQAEAYPAPDEAVIQKMIEP